MTWRLSVLGILLAMAAAQAVPAAEPTPRGQAGGAAEKPWNFVFVLIDDLGWADLGCYGNTFHETPNIDRLAKQGMRFTDAYAACPVCSPTRASILTGKYPATLNLTDFIPGHRRPWAKLVVPTFHQQLPPDEVTIAEMLRPHGYVSGSFGKWHLGGPEHYPNKQGFDEFVVTGGRHFYPRFRTTPKLDLKEGDYLADVLTDRAERFIRDHKDQPFFLYLSHYAVHIPLEARPQRIKKYEAKRSMAKHRSKVMVRFVWPGASADEVEKLLVRMEGRLRGDEAIASLVSKATRTKSGEGRGVVAIEFDKPLPPEEMKRRVDKRLEFLKLPETAARPTVEVQPVNNPIYAAMVEHADQSVGRLTRVLDELGIAESTVFIFFSDNGGLSQRFDKTGPIVCSNAPLRDEKGSLYEGGIRVPMIVRWPGVAKTGATCSTPVSSVDLWPTIRAIAATRAAKANATDAKAKVDGESLIPLLTQTGRLGRDAIYWHYPHYHHTTPAGAIRSGKYKLIEYFEDGRRELYDLTADPSETNDLAARMPEMARRLQARLSAWRQRVGAKPPTPNPDFDAAKADAWRKKA